MKDLVVPNSGQTQTFCLVQALNKPATAADYKTQVMRQPRQQPEPADPHPAQVLWQTLTTQALIQLCCYTPVGRSAEAEAGA